MPTRPWRGDPERNAIAVAISPGAARFRRAARRSIFASRPPVWATARDVWTRSWRRTPLLHHPEPLVPRGHPEEISEPPAHPLAVHGGAASYCGGTAPPSSWRAHDVEAAARLRADNPLPDRHQSDRCPTREQDEEIKLALQRPEEPHDRADISQGDLSRGRGRASQHRAPSRAPAPVGRGAA